MSNRGDMSLSPNSRQEGMGDKQIGQHFSVSPSRFASSRVAFNSEISNATGLMAGENSNKRISLHTYQIRNKNGSPTAQVTILKDGNDDMNGNPIDEQLEIASVS